MPDESIQQGDVFRIKSASLGGVKHRCIVASSHSSDSVVVVLPITSWDDWKDESCIISKQDYSPLAHNSCIDYHNGEIVSIAAIQRGLVSREIQRCPNVSPELLAKVLNGVKDSRFLKFECLNLLHKQGLVD